MYTRKYASFYSIFMGVSMISMWIMLLVSKQVPELAFKPIEIRMHISAEIITAILLIVGGYRFLKGLKLGYEIYLLSIGMLLYTLIMSPGYYMEKGEVGFIIMFAIFFIVTLYFLIKVLRMNFKGSER